MQQDHYGEKYKLFVSFGRYKHLNAEKCIFSFSTGMKGTLEQRYFCGEYEYFPLITQLLTVYKNGQLGNADKASPIAEWFRKDEVWVL